LFSTGQEDKGRKRAKNQKRFEALPKRESTYRLAKNLDAISRKAMLLYETSEMYTEQTTKRKRRKVTKYYHACTLHMKACTREQK